MDDTFPAPSVGMQFGIVCRLDLSFRSHAVYGVLCECVEYEYDQSANMDLKEGAPSSKAKGYVLLKAVGKFRFKID
jgi:hypothetical protein